MSAFEGDQLDALRDRVEEDFRRAEENYRLDIAAVEHLQRRFFGAVSGIATSKYSETTKGSKGESPATILPLQAAAVGMQSDGLEGSLRSMFHSSLK